MNYLEVPWQIPFNETPYKHNKLEKKINNKREAKTADNYSKTGLTGSFITQPCEYNNNNYVTMINMMILISLLVDIQIYA